MTPTAERIIFKVRNKIRLRLYKMGIHPKVGSIWHSPSLHLRFVAFKHFETNLQAMKDVHPVVEKARLREIERLNKENT